MEVSDQLHAPAALHQGKSPRYPLDRRLGGPQSRSEPGGEEKNSQPQPGVGPQNLDRPTRSKDSDKGSYNVTCYFMWSRNLTPHRMGRTETVGVWEQVTEESIWT
jgi:hypothetical protein